MAYTVLSAGGGGTRVTGQGKLVAVPWSVFTVSPDMTYLTTTVERDHIYNAPVFEYSRIGDTAFTSQVYSTFGVSAGATFSGDNATSTTTAGARTNANSMNNPPPPAEGPSATTAPSASVAPRASTSASPTGSPAATVAASAPATASASPIAATRGGRGYASPSPASSRPKGDEMTEGTSGQSTSEGTSSTSGKKSSRKGTTSEESTAGKSTREESSAEGAPSHSRKKSPHKKGGTKQPAASASPGGKQE